MATLQEQEQALGIATRIRFGASVRTDPRSPVGREVNRILQLSIDRQESLREQLKAGLLGEKEESRKEAERATTVIVGGKGFSVRPEDRESFIQDQLRRGQVVQFGGKTIRPPEQVREEVASPAVTPPTSRDIQAQVGKPSQVGLPSDEPRGFAKLGFFGATIATGKNILSRFKSPGKERTEFADILDPFDRTEKPKFGQEAFVIGGKSFSAEHLTGIQKSQLGKSGIEVTTFGEVQKGIEKGRGGEIEELRTSEEKTLQKEFVGLQQKIDIGELTLGEAQVKGKELTTEAQERFLTSQEQIFKTSPDIKGIRGEARSEIRTLVDIAAFATPLTSFIGAAAASKGDPLRIDITQLERGVSIEGATTQRPGLSTATFVAGGLIGGGLALSSAGKQVVLADVEASLIQAGLRQGGLRIPIKGGSIDLLTSEVISGDVASIQRSFSISRRIGEEIVTGGRVEQLSVGKTFFSQKPFIVGGSQEFGALTTPLKGSKGLSTALSDVTSQTKTQFSAVLQKRGLVGEAFSFEGAKLETQTIAGFGVKQGDFIISTGGRVRGITPRIKAKGRVEGDKTILDIDPGFKLDFPQESISILKTLKPKKDISSFGGRVPSAKKTPFATTFKEKTVSQFETKAFQPPQIKQTVKPVVETTPLGTGLPRSVGGLGLTDAQLLQARGGLMPKGVISPVDDIGIGAISLGRGGKGVPKIGFFKPTVTPFRSGLSVGGIGLVAKDISKSLTKQFEGQVTLDALQPRGRLKDRLELVQKQLTPQKLVQEPIFEDLITTPPPTTRGVPRFGFEGTGFILPPFNLLGGGGDKPKRKARAKSIVITRPSFTGIVLGIEEAATPVKFLGADLGILPTQIRGLATGFKVPKKKKKSKKKK